MRVVKYRRSGVWEEVERRRVCGGQTQAELAKRLGISTGQYSSVSLGRQGLSLRLLAALIREFPDLKERFLVAAGIVEPNKELVEG